MYNQQQQQPHRSEWKPRSQPPPRAVWSGHHPYHTQSGRVPVPHVHRPPPPPIHYPPHAQYRQQHHHHGANAGGHGHHTHHAHQHQQPYYHGHGSRTSSPAGYHPSVTQQRPKVQRSHHMHRAPTVVTPSSHPVSSAVSPISPQTVASSSPRDNVNARSSRSKESTPGATGATANATAAAAAAATVPAPANTHPSAAGNLITTKPPRPYTEYTMFYQLEREFILHRILPTDQERAMQGDPSSPGARALALFRNDPLMPARYRSLPLRADWYISGKSKKPTKRKHRKSHGKIGFLELTRMIAARWAKVDDETRKYCKMMAAMELVKYKEDMESYNQYKEQLSAIGEIPEDMKERMAKKQRAQEKKDANKRAKGAGGVAGGGVIASDKKGAASPAVEADAVGSNDATGARGGASAPKSAVKLEPLAHDSPDQAGGGLDNDMEEFITSLVRTPKAKRKVITPERAGRRRRLFRDRPATAIVAGPAAAASEDEVPLKDDDDHIDGIRMTFSGIDEGEMAREFADQVRPGPPAGSPAGAARKARGGVKVDPSFDYWDVLVESPDQL